MAGSPESPGRATDLETWLTPGREREKPGRSRAFYGAAYKPKALVARASVRRLETAVLMLSLVFAQIRDSGRLTEPILADAAEVAPGI